MKENHKNVLRITQGALIAALYVVLTLTFAPISFGPLQLRVSEALIILPMFTAAAVPGLFAGCLLANILGGAVIWDVIFGSLATLIGAVGTYFLGRKVSKWLSPVPPIVANTLIIPFVLQYAYGVPDGIPFLMLTVGAGEVLSCGVLGLLLLNAIEPVKKYIFSKET